MKNLNTVKPVLSGIAHGLSRQRGASLLEGIAYLGIAAIVVLGAVSLLTSAFGSAKTNQTREEIISLRTAVRKLYAGQIYPKNKVVDNLYTASAIPNTLVVTAASGSSPSIKNNWAGSVTIAGDDAGSFSIIYDSVPKDVCIGVVSGATGWTSISDANNKTVTTFPASADNAATVCGSSANKLTFTAT